MIGAFVLTGLLCGWLWYHLWAPAPQGVVYNHVPRFQDDADFRGPGSYFLIAVVAGLLLGLVLTYLLERDEVWTLAAVVVGALVAGGLMAGVGALLGPESAATVAERAEDFDKVSGDLHVPLQTVLTSFPGGALLGSVIVLTCFARRGDRTRPAAAEEPVPTVEETGLDRGSNG